MGSRGQHAIDIVYFLLGFLILQHHKVTFEVIDVQVELDRLEVIVIRVVITFARQVLEVMLRPSFTDPAVGVYFKLE